MEASSMSRAYGIDGIEYPSVTTILGVLDKGEALLGWAVKCAIEYVRKNLQHMDHLDSVLGLARAEWRNAREEAADIGTEIHDLIHKYIKFGKDATGSYRPEVEKGFLAFLEWEKAHNVKWISTELQIVSRVHGFAGTLDAICLFDGKKYLIDFKSSKGFYDGYDMQLAAYRVGAAELGNHTEGCGILRLDKETGAPEWKDYSDVQAQAEAAFLALVRFYYLQKPRKLKNNPFNKLSKSKTKIEKEILV
jgi:hypothetical protein